MKKRSERELTLRNSNVIYQINHYYGTKLGVDTWAQVYRSLDVQRLTEQIIPLVRLLDFLSRTSVVEVEDMVLYYWVKSHINIYLYQQGYIKQ